MADKSTKDKKPEGDKPKASKPEVKEKRNVHKVRILATDIDASKSLLTGLACVKGVGHNLANALIIRMRMDPKKKLVSLSDDEIDKVERAVGNPSALNIPVWMLNRRKDPKSGGDIHLSTSDLTFAVKEDINDMGEIKSYKGLRHAKGLKVRGQRTASTGRGQSAVGVQRKKNQQSKAT